MNNKKYNSRKTSKDFLNDIMENYIDKIGRNLFKNYDDDLKFEIACTNQDYTEFCNLIGKSTIAINAINMKNFFNRIARDKNITLIEWDIDFYTNFLDLLHELNYNLEYKFI